MGKTIIGTTTLEVSLTTSPTVIDGTIATTGTFALYGSAAKTWNITNNGLVSGSLSDGIYLAGGGDITNTANAIIIAYNGIVAHSATTIDNAGTISGSGAFGTGIVLIGTSAIAEVHAGGGASSPGAITNSADGVISGAFGLASFEGAAFNLLNKGIIESTSTANLEAVFAQGTITNAAGGTIIGGTGIVLDGGTIINAGLIEATNTAGKAIELEGSANNVVSLQSAGTLIGDISAFIAGDTIDEAGLTLTAETFSNGTLTLFDGAATVSTLQFTGDLNTSAFTLSADGHGGTNIKLGAETFTGTYGAFLELAALSNTFASTAYVTSQATGVYGSDYRDWTLVNHGTINAGSLANGVQFFGAAQITNTGIIQAGTGIEFSSGTLTNSGTIAGSRGTAINLIPSPGDADIILKSGSTLIGDIAGFETGDTIDLANITATKEKIANGVLTLTNAGTVVDTIALYGLFNTGGFKLAKAPGGGTDITAAPTETFSGHYGVALTLSSLFTTITNTGSLGASVYGSRDRNWTLINSGSITGAFNGIEFESGQLTNTTNGVITGRDGLTGDGVSIVVNAGIITGAGSNYSYGIDLYGTGAVTNLASGTIAGAATGMELFGETAINYGKVTGATGIYLSNGAVYNYGKITGSGGANIYTTYRDTGINERSGYAYNAGSIAGVTGVRLSNGVFYNAGRIQGLPGGYKSGLYGGAYAVASQGASISGGILTNYADALISGAYGVVLNGGTLVDAGTIASTLASAAIAIAIGIADSTLVLDKGNVVKGAISGFIAGDILDFAATTITSDTFSNGVLSVFDGSKVVEKLSITGYLNAKDFTIIPEGKLGTELIIGQEIFSGSYANGITLSAPTTITKTGIINGTGSAIYGSTARDWTLFNQGLLTGTIATYGDAVEIRGNANISNASTGTIIGAFVGINAGGYAGNATLINAGTILATGTALNAVAAYISGTVINTGLIEGKNGLDIASGGIVTNAGTIASSGGGNAIKFSGSKPAALTEDIGAKLLGAIAGFTGADIIDFAGQTLTGETFSNNTLALTNNGVTIQSLTFAAGLVASEFTLTSDNAGGTKLVLGPELLTGTYQYGITLTAARTSIAASALVEVLAGHAGPGNPSGYALVDDSGTGHTIINSGQIIDTYSGKSGAFLGDDTFVNNIGATVSGSAGIKIYGVRSGPYASIDNAGTIIGIRPGGYGMDEAYGVLSNAQSGIFTGGSGVFLYDVIATNAGILAGTTYSGADFTGAYGAITNLASGTITGGTGISFRDTGTVQNAGTIDGAGGTAIYFGPGASRFIADPGSTLIGGVTAVAATNVLELASAATAGTLAAIGETITGFSTITFDSGAAFTIAGDIAGLASGQTIENFSSTDTIILDNFSASSFSTIAGGLILKHAGASVTLDVTPGPFSVRATGTTTTITTSAALVPGAVITTGALTATPMHFLRPQGWVVDQAITAIPASPNPAASAPKTAFITIPTLSGWVTLDPAPRPTIPAITLQAG